MQCADTAVIGCRPTAANVFEWRDWLRLIANSLTDAAESRPPRLLKQTPRSTV
jgi:hypothetical protein